MRKNWKSLFCSIVKMSLLMGALCSLLPAASRADDFLKTDINIHIGQMLTAEHMNGEIIVKFKDEIAHDPAVMEKRSVIAHGRAGAVVKRKFKRLKGLQCVRLQKLKNIREALQSYLESPDIEYAEPNYITRIETSPDDTDFDTLWGLHNAGQTGGTVDADIDAPEAWDIFTGNPDVIVAVIDTGVDYTHNDLSANIWRNTGQRN